MKKLVLIFCVVTLFNSCNKQEKEITTTKIEKLEKELENRQKQIDSLKKTNLDITEKFISFSKEHNEGYISKEYASFFLKDKFKFTTNKQQVIQFFFDHLNLNEWDLDRGVVNSYLIDNYSNNQENKHEDITSKEGLCSYIISKIARNPESLEKVFSPNTKTFIASLLKKDNLYKKAGVYTIVKAMLYAYQEIDNDDLARIYEIASNEDFENTLNFISKIESKKAKKLLENTEDYTTYKTWSNKKSRMFLVYTFWARRYHEGNKKYVYTFLSELHNSLTNEELEP